MSDKPELKPCPFCGGEAKYTEFKHEPSGSILEGVRCVQCNAMCLSQAWNQRADLAKPSECDVLQEQVADLQCQNMGLMATLLGPEYAGKGQAVYFIKDIEALHKAAVDNNTENKP